MKTKISIITAAALAATASAFAQDNTYYYVGGTATDASSWNTAADGSGTALGGTFLIHDKGIYFTAAVPEPATVAALLGLAALGLAIARRRR